MNEKNVTVNSVIDLPERKVLRFTVTDGRQDVRMFTIAVDLQGVLVSVAQGEKYSLRPEKNTVLIDYV